MHQILSPESPKPWIMLVYYDCQLRAALNPEPPNHGQVESGTGVVRDESVRARVCTEVQEWLVTQGWEPKGLTTR